MLIERASPEDWDECRRIRLAALAESPMAFAATLADEQDLGEKDWRAQLTNGTTFLARGVDHRVLGTVTAIPDAYAADLLHLVAMYVVPEARGRGYGRALVDAVVHAAEEAGAKGVVLAVASGNDRAERLYRAAGFRPTGRSFRLPHSPWMQEIEMRRDVRPR
jgi:ribosomal protein S18 acetylase RimI-like enzyme